MKKLIIYTNSGEKKIESVLQKLKSKIEEDIKESKNYPGEEYIEITAADIEDVYERVYLRPRKSKNLTRNRMLKQILPIYFLVGIGMMVYGLFYSQIEKLMADSPEKIIFVLGGFAFSLVTAVMYMLLKQRDVDRRKELITSKYEQEAELIEHRIKYEEILQEVIKRLENKDKPVPNKGYDDNAG